MSTENGTHAVNAIDPSNWFDVPLGVDMEGQPIAIDLRETAHIEVSGSVGSGSTVTLRRIAFAALDHGHDVYWVDPGKAGIDVHDLADRLTSPVATDPFEAAALLRSVYEEKVRRHGLMGAEKLSHWTNLATPLRPITVVLDLYSFLADKGLAGVEKTEEDRARNEARKEAVFFAESLVRQGRSAGIHLAVNTTQISHPFAISSGIDAKVFLINRNVGQAPFSPSKVAGRTEADDTLGASLAESHPDARGNGLALLKRSGSPAVGIIVALD